MSLKKHIWQNIVVRWILPVVISFFNQQSSYANGGIHFKYLFEKGAMKCTTEYKITGSFPITIKRTYQNGESESIILIPIKPEHARELYDLVNKSRDHLQKYPPRIIEYLGKNEETTRSFIEMNYLSRTDKRISLLIYFKKRKSDTLRLVGKVGAHSYDFYKPKSVDGVYWMGDPKHTEVKGVAGIAIQALFNHLIATGEVKHVNLVMHKENIRSINIAKRFGMKNIDPKSYKKWRYEESKNEVFVFTLSAKKWMAKHWHDVK